MTLRILYACVTCRLIVPGTGYNLNFMYGKPAICTRCANGRT